MAQLQSKTAVAEKPLEIDPSALSSGDFLAGVPAKSLTRFMEALSNASIAHLQSLKVLSELTSPSLSKGVKFEVSKSLGKMEIGPGRKLFVDSAVVSEEFHEAVRFVENEKQASERLGFPRAYENWKVTPIAERTKTQLASVSWRLLPSFVHQRLHLLIAEQTKQKLGQSVEIPLHENEVIASSNAAIVWNAQTKLANPTGNVSRDPIASPDVLRYRFGLLKDGAKALDADIWKYYEKNTKYLSVLHQSHSEFNSRVDQKIKVNDAALTIETESRLKTGREKIAKLKKESPEVFKEGAEASAKYSSEDLRLEQTALLNLKTLVKDESAFKNLQAFYRSKYSEIDVAISKAK